MKKLEPGDIEIAGKTLEEWNLKWVLVAGGFGVPHPNLRHQIGLYRGLLGGEVKVLGYGVNRGGGLAKRLGDFRTKSGYARGHQAGQFIHDNLDLLQLEVLVTGRGREARATAEKLVGPMLEFHNPSESVPRRLRPY